MAKGKAKKKAKAKTKAKVKTNAKVKAKGKVKPKPKAKAKPKPRPKAKTKTKPRNTPPPAATPNVCDSFTAETGQEVEWEDVPATGCTIKQNGSNTWPFNIGPPIDLPSTSTISIAVGAGTYTFVPECCDDGVPKTVTVP
jgi:hypothetical protein